MSRVTPQSGPNPEAVHEAQPVQDAERTQERDPVPEATAELSNRAVGALLDRPDPVRGAPVRVGQILSSPVGNRVVARVLNHGSDGAAGPVPSGFADQLAIGGGRPLPDD